MATWNTLNIVVHVLLQVWMWLSNILLFSFPFCSSYVWIFMHGSHLTNEWVWLSDNPFGLHSRSHQFFFHLPPLFMHWAYFSFICPPFYISVFLAKFVLHIHECSYLMTNHSWSSGRGIQCFLLGHGFETWKPQFLLIFIIIITNF